MDSDPYQEWINLYDQDAVKIWSQECVELKKVAMILHVLQKELNNVQSTINEQVLNIRKQLKRRNDYEKTNRLTLSLSPVEKKALLENKENTPRQIVHISNDASINTESPDFFHDLDINIGSSNMNESYDTTINESPTLNKQKKFRYKKNKDQSSLYFNIEDKDEETNMTPKTDAVLLANKEKVFKTPIAIADPDILECSIIDNTPEIKSKKNKSGKGSFFIKKKASSSKSGTNKKSNDTTITQMFGDITTKRKSKKTDNHNPDESYFKEIEKKSSLEISEMLNYIDKLSSDDTSAISNISANSQDDSTHLDSKIERELLNNSPKNKSNIAKFESFVADYDRLPEQKVDEPSYAYKGEAVRGGARKKLPGWSCYDCKKFYENLNLSPEELEKKMNDCSRHRAKFKPHQETFTGFWDLSFNTQASQSK